MVVMVRNTLPETNIAPKNGWLKFGILVSLFSGATLVSGNVNYWKIYNLHIALVFQRKYLLRVNGSFGSDFGGPVMTPHAEGVWKPTINKKNVSFKGWFLEIVILPRKNIENS